MYTAKITALGNPGCNEALQPLPVINASRYWEVFIVALPGLSTYIVNGISKREKTDVERI